MSSPRRPDGRELRAECAATGPLLSLLVGDDATAEEVREARAHTAECPHCASELARLTWARRALRRAVPADRLPAAVPVSGGDPGSRRDPGPHGGGVPPLDDRWFAAMQREVLDRTGRVPPRSRSLRPWFLPLGLAAAALAILAIEPVRPADPVVRTEPRAAGSRSERVPGGALPVRPAADPVAAVAPGGVQGGAQTAGWRAPRLGGSVGGRSGRLQGLQGQSRVEELIGVRLLVETEVAPALTPDQPLSPLDGPADEAAVWRHLPWLEPDADGNGWVLRWDGEDEAESGR